MKEKEPIILEKNKAGLFGGKSSPRISIRVNLNTINYKKNDLR